MCASSRGEDAGIGAALQMLRGILAAAEEIIARIGPDAVHGHACGSAAFGMMQGIAASPDDAALRLPYARNGLARIPHTSQVIRGEAILIQGTEIGTRTLRRYAGVRPAFQVALRIDDVGATQFIAALIGTFAIHRNARRAAALQVAHRIAIEERRTLV